MWEALQLTVNLVRLLVAEERGAGRSASVVPKRLTQTALHESAESAVALKSCALV